MCAMPMGLRGRSESRWRLRRRDSDQPAVQRDCHAVEPAARLQALRWTKAMATSAAVPWSHRGPGDARVRGEEIRPSVSRPPGSPCGTVEWSRESCRCVPHRSLDETCADSQRPSSRGVIEPNVIAVEVADVGIGPIPEENSTSDLPRRAVRDDGNQLASSAQPFSAPPEKWSRIDDVLDDVGQHNQIVRLLEVGFDIGSGDADSNPTAPQRCLLGPRRIGLDAIDETRPLAEPLGETSGPTSDIENRGSGDQTLAHEVPAVELIDVRDAALVSEALGIVTCDGTGHGRSITDSGHPSMTMTTRQRGERVVGGTGVNRGWSSGHTTAIESQCQV